MLYRDDGGLDLSIEDIYEYLRNRPPMLLIDSATVYPGKTGISFRKLKDDEWFFKAHFPGLPMVPGVLQLEAMFNLAAVVIKTQEGLKERLTNISRVSEVSYYDRILPGQTMEIHADILKPYRRGVALVAGKIFVENELRCEAEFKLSVPEDMIMR